MNNYIFLLILPVGNATFYFTTDGVDFDYNGDTYLAGFWPHDQVPDIKQTSRPQENQVKFELHDLDGTLITNLLSAPWRNKKMQMFRVKLDQYQQLQTITRIYHGEITGYVHNETDNSKIITFESVDLAAVKTSRGYRSNITSQHQRDPDDDCFEQTPFILTDVAWGKAKTYSPGTYSNTGGATRKDRYATEEVYTV
ncbi:hypothetical protein [Neptunicella sp.]|uniref:hypothetical protein n=1 Tax=Neptunicella sp. TaxID=2125986 RepID=UPI003F68E18C